MMTHRLRNGFLWGIAATVAMSILMLGGMLLHLSPMPKPIPAALVGKLLGPGLPRPALMALAALSHLGYGGAWGAALAGTIRGRVTLAHGIVLGVMLWVLMQLLVLPWLGWGVFGAGVTPRIAVATLILHLGYGSVLGWGLQRAAKRGEGTA